MTINDQIKDEKLQYDINREAAKISALSSGKLHKYEYLTGEDILPSNQQQIIEQTKFTYSPLGKTFEKQTKTIEDHGKKQVEALENLKPKEETKPIEDKSNNQPKSTTIFNELMNKRKKIMRELYDSVHYKDLKLECIGPTEDVSFYEYGDSKELLNGIKMDYVEMLSDANYNAKQNKTEGKGFKILTTKQMLQRLPIGLAQVKPGNNSENLLNEIRQIIYSLYQSKEITKKYTTT